MSGPDSVVLETSMGDIQLELYWIHAPKVHIMLLKISDIPFTLIMLQTCKNFAELAKQGYYNKVVFHRIVSVRIALGLLTI